MVFYIVPSCIFFSFMLLFKLLGEKKNSLTDAMLVSVNSQVDVAKSNPGKAAGWPLGMFVSNCLIVNLSEKTQTTVGSTIP